MITVMNISKSNIGTRRDRSAKLLERVGTMLETTDRSARHFPPTTLYNETWMLRLVVDWYATHRPANGLLSPTVDATWYSEARLPSRFLRGLKNEGYTCADAVIGHFNLLDDNGSIQLKPNPQQFVVVEAKMNSPLSKGITHAPKYNQAARNVACMIHLLDGVHANEMPPDCRFIVLAPSKRLDEVKGFLEPATLVTTIAERAKLRDTVNHDGDEKWLKNTVEPRLIGGQIKVVSLSWETLLQEIENHDPEGATALEDFYGKCLEFNMRLVNR